MNNEDALNDCSFLEQVNADVSVTLQKAGFHRELVTTVRLDKHGLPANVLLVYNFPKDIYVDPYQIESLGDQRNWQMLLDSAIDLEMPAHKSSEFHTYLYPLIEEPAAEQIKVTIPIHGRYQKPSFDENLFHTVVIPPPDLLLRPAKKCAELNNVDSLSLVDAPCTANNLSTCQWIKVHHKQLPGPVSVELPVGDATLIVSVSAGTLLVTIICCVALSITAWTHRIE